MFSFCIFTETSFVLACRTLGFSRIGIEHVASQVGKFTHIRANNLKVNKSLGLILGWVHETGDVPHQCLQCFGSCCFPCIASLLVQIGLASITVYVHLSAGGLLTR